MIDEELDGACEYSRSALKYKESHPALAKVFYDIANQEMQHVDALHGQVSNIINTQKSAGIQPPEMMAIYEYVHKKQIDKAAKVKAYLAQYK